jgi:hypothetical protein
LRIALKISETIGAVVSGNAVRMIDEVPYRQTRAPLHNSAFSLAILYSIDLAFQNRARAIGVATHDCNSIYAWTKNFRNSFAQSLTVTQ